MGGLKKVWFTVKNINIPADVKESSKIIMKVSVATLIGNFLLTAFKLFAGFFAHSSAMVADAIHSASDVFSTLLVMLGAYISGKESDKEHPYGHERMECAVSIILAVVLFLTGLMIGVNAAESIINGGYSSSHIPGALALAAAVVSIVSKELMYHYTIHYAKRINSVSLKADAWHHRSDAISSVGSFIGILFAMIGFPVMDSVASLLICLLIVKVSYDIFKETLDKMVDHSCSGETVDRIAEKVLEQEGVIDIDMIKTRLFGPRIYVDIEIAADGSQTLWQSHAIAERVHNAIEAQFPEVKHCMVHVNPR